MYGTTVGTDGTIAESTQTFWAMVILPSLGRYHHHLGDTTIAHRWYHHWRYHCHPPTVPLLLTDGTIATHRCYYHQVNEMSSTCAQI
ncbi:hypothetical protein BHE74_00058792 [Ensete ventricosum]|nr:hypothetical protein BHE74_00058792 [Ensete ventricosum]